MKDWSDQWRRYFAARILVQALQRRRPALDNCVFSGVNSWPRWHCAACRLLAAEAAFAAFMAADHSPLSRVLPAERSSLSGRPRSARFMIVSVLVPESSANSTALKRSPSKLT